MLKIAANDIKCASLCFTRSPVMKAFALSVKKWSDDNQINNVVQWLESIISPGLHNLLCFSFYGPSNVSNFKFKLWLYLSRVWFKPPRCLIVPQGNFLGGRILKKVGGEFFTRDVSLMAVLHYSIYFLGKPNVCSHFSRTLSGTAYVPYQIRYSL